VRIERTTSPDWRSEFNKDFRALRAVGPTGRKAKTPSSQRIIIRRWTQTGEQQSAKRMAQSVKSIVLRAVNRRWTQIDTDEEN